MGEIIPMVVMALCYSNSVHPWSDTVFLVSRSLQIFVTHDASLNKTMGVRFALVHKNNLP